VVSDEIQRRWYSRRTGTSRSPPGPGVRPTHPHLHSATKAWGLAGLLPAVAVPGTAADDAWLRGLSYRHRGAASILGIDTAVAAFTTASPGWMPLLVTWPRHARTSRRTAAPGYPRRMVPTESTYLAWLDARALAGPHPAAGFPDPRSGGPQRRRHVRLHRRGLRPPELRHLPAP